MALILLEQAENYLTPDLIKRAGVLVNETPEKTERAMSCIVPALLAGVLDSVSSPAGPERLTQMVTDGGFESKLIAFTSDQADSTLSGFLTTGKLIIASLFGSRVDSITENIARNSGIRQSSAASLTALAAPLVMGLLGREVGNKGLSGSSLLTLLMGQRDSILGNLPSGLGSLFSWQPTTAPVAKQRTRISSDEVVVAPPQPNRAALWLATVMLLAGGMILISWLRTPDQQTRARLSSIHLPGGATLHASETSMNYALANYLGGQAGQEEKRRFVFDSLTFNSGSAQPTDESIRIIRDLATILSAYSGATIRLEGYTDNTGDAGANRELSQQRAESIKALLVQNGVDESHIDTVGFGSDNPIASNDTEAGRLSNRRTELVVQKP